MSYFRAYAQLYVGPNATSASKCTIDVGHARFIGKDMVWLNVKDSKGNVKSQAHTVTDCTKQLRNKKMAYGNTHGIFYWGPAVPLNVNPKDPYTTTNDSFTFVSVSLTWYKTVKGKKVVSTEKVLYGESNIV